MYTKEEFEKVWADSSVYDILNQFYYEHTELQKAIKENERLKEENNEDYVYLSRKYDWIADYNMKLIEKLVTLEDYKSRCEKAIEILHSLNDTLPLDIILSEIEHSEYILQNGSEDNGNN